MLGPRALASFAGMAALALSCGTRTSSNVSPAAPPEPDTWQVVARDLPSALMSIDGTSASDVYAVGADKGRGPLVLHYDGVAWAELSTSARGDLWWVHAFPGGVALAGGANATVLRVSGVRVERLATPGLGRQTVYGVWGASPDDFYAVGSAAGRNGFVWHYAHGAFEEERLPLDLPRMAGGELPGFFKAWGRGDEVWIVGAAGTILHRQGQAPFTVVASGTKDTLFTVHGTRDRLLTVGGSSNGVVLGGTGASWSDVSPRGAGLLQGVYASEADGDWASGERAMIYQRPATGGFQPIDHELGLPTNLSLHAIFVDSSHGVWSVGGDVLSPALDSGTIVHLGARVPDVVLRTAAAKAAEAAGDTCPAEVVAAGKAGSVARRWDEQALNAIRLDLPRPTVHARNLFHLSAAMWDAWAAYDGVARGVFVDERHRAADTERSRRAAVSYAAFGVLSRRYRAAVGGAQTLACLRAVMTDLGYDPLDTHDVSTPAEADDPIALGNRIAHHILSVTHDDGANEAADYADTTAYVSPNEPLVYDSPGTTMVDPNVWQPLNLAVAATQNGIVLPSGVQTYIGAQWGDVTPFAMKRASRAVAWHDPGAPPRVGPEMKRWLTEVIAKTAELDTGDPTMIDLSPGAMGNNSLGANDGRGFRQNPVTGKPYARNAVLRADFARVMAEFWADGPKSETPPGHWNVFANMVSDTPGFEKRLFGKGRPLDALAWDVHVYLALNGAVHDAAITAWDNKRRLATSRPICLIRWMGAKGQSSDPKGPSYDADGLPLVPGLIEVITKESSAKGERHERLAFYVGQVAVRGWRGEPGDRESEEGGATWMRAVDWIPYQRRNFVTPAFPGFISGHSTFSRAGAEVLTALTGSPYFPGGLAEYVAKAGAFLKFEKGPTADVRLQWAAYGDAADQAGQSRLWGGIHLAPDDFVGRKLGYRVGRDAVAHAARYFDGSIPRGRAL